VTDFKKYTVKTWKKSSCCYQDQFLPFTFYQFA